MKLACRLFGHKIPAGYYGYGANYFRVNVFAIDGIERIHAKLTTECERCETVFTVGNIHLPMLLQHEANMLVRKEK